MAEPPKFGLTDEAFAELVQEIRDLVVARTPDLRTGLSVLLSITASLAEVHLVTNERWNIKGVTSMRDYFAVNMLRSHDLRVAQEGGDTGDVKHEDLFSPELLKRAGLMQ